jgi:large subunit ribosomal protein L7e
LIEKSLGEVTNGSIICVQDLIHELYTVGEEFHTVNKFLWTFQLSAPKSKFQKDKLSFKDGGEYGDRGEEMDDLIRQML